MFGVEYTADVVGNFKRKKCKMRIAAVQLSAIFLSLLQNGLRPC